MSYPDSISVMSKYSIDFNSLNEAIKSKFQTKSYQMRLRDKKILDGLSSISMDGIKTCADSGRQAFSQAFYSAGVPKGYKALLIDEAMKHKRRCLEVKVREIFPASSVIINWLAEYYSRWEEGFRVVCDEMVHERHVTYKTHDRMLIHDMLEKRFKGRRPNLIMAYKRINADFQRARRLEEAAAEADRKGPEEVPKPTAYRTPAMTGVQLSFFDI